MEITTAVDAVDRIDDSPTGWALADGTPIASSLADRTDGMLDNPISHTAAGGPVTTPFLVYTGTLPDGTVDSDTCDDWSGTIGTGGFRLRSIPNGVWTRLGYTNCTNSLSVYCFEVDDVDPGF